MSAMKKEQIATVFGGIPAERLWCATDASQRQKTESEPNRKSHSIRSLENFVDIGASGQKIAESLELVQHWL
jgi:hypothetical protein